VTDSFVQYAATAGVATLTLNRPDSRNAIGAQQDCLDVIDAFRRAEEDAGISCIVLTGAGASFCAGGNLKGMQARSGIGRLGTPEATRTNYRRGVQRMIRALWDCEVPMVAAVNGHAIGLGLDLACICDIRLPPTAPGSPRASSRSASFPETAAPGSWRGPSACRAHRR